MPNNMLRITSQLFNRNHGIDSVYEDTQCEGCGVYARQLSEMLTDCEFCHQSFCPNCIGLHEREHYEDQANGIY